MLIMNSSMSSTTLFCVEGESIMFLIVIAVLGYVLYVIQHKTFKVGFKKIIILFVMLMFIRYPKS